MGLEGCIGRVGTPNGSDIWAWWGVLGLGLEFKLDLGLELDLELGLELELELGNGIGIGL